MSLELGATVGHARGQKYVCMILVCAQQSVWEAFGWLKGPEEVWHEDCM